KNGHVYMIDEEGGIRPLLYLGSAPVIAVERVGNPGDMHGDMYRRYVSPQVTQVTGAGEDTFAAFNMDGTFVIFKL
ncbi:MAG: hypothetical protein OEW05_13855, partial [Candidatus Aminicenantes bacterium]|nr:hypothetical protein [Candidatus Aminicenantes bacterium]